MAVGTTWEHSCRLRKIELLLKKNPTYLLGSQKPKVVAHPFSGAFLGLLLNFDPIFCNTFPGVTRCHQKKWEFVWSP